jgi:hypothetical protein
MSLSYRYFFLTIHFFVKLDRATLNPRITDLVLSFICREEPSSQLANTGAWATNEEEGGLPEHRGSTLLNLFRFTKTHFFINKSQTTLTDGF